MSQDLLQILPLLEDEDLLDVALMLEFNKDDPIGPGKFVFDLHSFTDQDCYLNFRFYKSDIIRLVNCLGIPSVVKCENQVRVGGTEALCILLRRLAYPNRYVDLMKLFPRTRCELSRICKVLIQHIVLNYGHLVRTLNHPLLNMETLREFSKAIYDKGSPYINCFGFLDGTVRPMSRPTNNQKEFYNGHKRTHALKFQSVMLPNGIIGSMHGPVSGRRHDAFLLSDSKLLETLENSFYDADGKPFHLYGDPAYPLKKHLIVPFKGYNLTMGQRLCNKKMSQVRQSVEWGFGKVIQNFAFLDFKKNLKFELQPVADMYIVGSILTNCHTCIYGSNTSDYFNLSPPQLEDYLISDK